MQASEINSNYFSVYTEYTFGGIKYRNVEKTTTDEKKEHIDQCV